MSRLKPTEAIPSWAREGALLSITRTTEELSIVSESKLVPADVQQESDWRCLKVEGKLDFSMMGVLTSLLNPLAESAVSVFVMSTYDTDYVFVKGTMLVKSLQILKASGHEIDSH